MYIRDGIWQCDRSAARGFAGLDVCRSSRRAFPGFRYALKAAVSDMAVSLTLEIPQDLAALLGAPDRNLSRIALEALAAGEYRAHPLSDAQFRRMLDISRFEADRILKAHGVWLEYGIEDFERESAAIGSIQERIQP